jgi:hypothetical protein
VGVFANPGYWTPDIFVIGRIRSKSAFKDIILVTFSTRKAKYKEAVCKRMEGEWVKRRRGGLLLKSEYIPLLSHHFTFPETTQP